MADIVDWKEAYTVALEKIKLLEQQKEFAEFEWNRATEGMQVLTDQVDRAKQALQFVTGATEPGPCVRLQHGIACDDLAKVVSERDHARLQVERMQWRPIETAPRDGSDVLVWCDEGMDIARYSERQEDGPDEMGYDAGWWGVCQPMDPGRSMGAPAYTRAPEHQPWAWMPQPMPPYDDEGEPLFPKTSSVSSTELRQEIPGEKS